MKYLGPIDYLLVGMYSILSIQSLISKNHVVVFSCIVAVTHYLPCMYLLRKHGYIENNDVKLKETKKGQELILTLFVKPIKKFVSKPKELYFSLLILFLDLFLFLILLTLLQVLLKDLAFLDF